MKQNFYVTAAIPYVNAKPHIGHALEFVQTDTIARYHRLSGQEVATLSGGDENALKNIQAAEAKNVPPQQFVDTNTEAFKKLAISLNAEFTFWQKGSDKKQHFPASQKLWQLCNANGDIYKKKYEGLYCVGCETFYPPEELNEKGECFEHPGKPLQKVFEENYFFALSKYQKRLIELISSDEIKIYPDFRKNEVLSFLKKPLQDISISRTNRRAKNWGVPVPGDPDQRIYVWFDALNIYQSGIGFGWDEQLYQKWWPADVHVIGKGIIRFHAVYWPAFLISAGLLLPKSIFVHGYLTVNGQKMSKTTGNVVDPVGLINAYGSDALRYYLLAKTPPFDDGDFSEEKLKDAYNADLANGLGNLIARTAKLADGITYTGNVSNKIPADYKKAMDSFRFDQALNLLWKKIKLSDQYLNDCKPWEVKGAERKNLLKPVIDTLRMLSVLLQPFLPETAEKIEDQFAGPKIKTDAVLFPRK